MTKATKEAMSADARVAALQDCLIRNAKMSASESKKMAEGLIKKYGDKAEELAINCLMRPYEINKALGMEGKCTSLSMLEYFNKEKRSAKIVNASLDKTGKIKVKFSAEEKKQTKSSLKQYADAKIAEAQKIAEEARKKARATRNEAAIQRMTTPQGFKPKTTAEITAIANRSKEKAKGMAASQTKTNTTTKSGDKMKAYDWVGNERPTWEPKPMTASATPKTQTATNAKTKASKTVATKNSGTSRSSTSPAVAINIDTHNWGKNAPEPWQSKSIEKLANPQGSKVMTADEKLAKAKGNKGYITFDDLRKDGIDVTSSDLQTVINQQKTLDDKAKIINSITPGKKSQDLGNWMANNTTGKPEGNCLSGIQKGMEAGVYNAPNETSPISGNNEEWNDYKIKGKTGNSACDAHNLLDNSGDWFTVDVPNKAYHNPEGNAEMKTFNSKLRPDILGSAENKVVEGSRGITFENESASAKHGHIWLRGKNGENLCDGIQSEYGIDFTRYGKEVYVTLSSDSKIPDDLAMKLIQESEKRRKQYSMLQENVYAASKTR